MAITTTPSGGPQGEFSTYTPIYSQTLSSTATSVIFSNIPTTYTDLVIEANTVASGSAMNLTINLNGDTNTNYSITTLYARSDAATTVKSIRANNATYALANYGTATATDARSASCITFLNYSNTTTFKSILVRAATAHGSGTYSGNEIITNQWRSTSPITSITLGGGTFASGCTFTLYGIKAAATPPKATGGDVITTDGTYWYHAFLSTGTFTPTTSLTCDYLVVAGGGGGGSNAGGGAGGGGLRLATSQSLTISSYAVSIGAGGMYGATNGSTTGTNGTNSSFNGLSASGGGRGGMNGFAGSAGGSGGGGAGSGYAGGAGNAGSYSPVEGYAGGTGVGFAGAGGGGAAGAAANASGSNSASNGGAGANSYNGTTFTSWLTATVTGASGYLAGGGGGGSEGGTKGNGGIGGGGNGGQANGNGTSGTTNTGSGGGGGSNGAVVLGGAGGSGLVIVRYAV